jgi:chromosome segregation ATPase
VGIDKMEEKDNSRFKIRFDDDTAEEAERRKAVSLSSIDNDVPQIDILSRRVTMIGVAIPVVVIILFVFAYVSINKNVANSTAAGMENYRKLSQDLEKSLSDLSIKSEKLKETVEIETSSFEKKTDLFTKSLNKNAAAIKGLDKQIKGLKETDKSKIGKKEFRSYTVKMEKEIKSLKSELESLRSDRKALRAEMKKEIEILQDTLGTIFEVLQKLKVDMVSLSESQINKEKLDNALQRQHEKYSHALEVVTEKFDKQLSEIRKSQTESPKPDKVQPVPDKSNLTETDISG